MSEIEQLTQPDTMQVPCKFPIDYVPQWSWRPDLPSVTEEAPKPEPKQRKRPVRPEPGDEETIRRPDILVSVAVLGESKHCIGEEIEPAKIRTMKEKLDTLFSAYETKLGQEMTENGMETIVGSAVKLINWFVPIDDTQSLKQDLLDNKPLRRSPGRHCAGMAERYGDVVAFSKVLYDVVKHIKLDTQESASTNQEKV